MKSFRYSILLLVCGLMFFSCDDLLRNDIPRGRENPEDPDTIIPIEGQAEIHITLDGIDYFHEDTYTFPVTPENSSNKVNGKIFNISADTSLYLDVNTPVILEGLDPGEFFVIQPLISEVIPGGSIDFSIDFVPGSSGLKNAQIRLPNNDPNEGDYTIILKGEAEVSLSTEGDISLRLNDGTEIPNNSSYHVGSAELNSSISFQLVIENQHQVNDLTFPNSESIRITGNDNICFQIQNQPAGPLAPQATFDVFITYTPTYEGAKEAVLEIESDDSDENPYKVFLTADTIAVGGVGEITIFSMNQEWFELDTMFFEDTLVGSQRYMDIEISNVGSGDLTLGSSPSVEVSGMGFQLAGVPEPNRVIPANQSITFTLIFFPQTPGNHYGTLTIFSNDSDEPSYDLFVSGNALDLQGSLLPDSNLSDGEIILVDSYIAPRFPGSGSIQVGGDITVNSGATLTIYEGVDLLMADNSRIIVYGSLQIFGLSGKEVRINGNSWNGIKLQGDAIIHHAYLDGFDSNAIKVGETGSPGRNLTLGNSRIHHRNNYDAIVIALSEPNSTYSISNNIFVYTSTSGSQGAVEVYSSVTNPISVDFMYNTVVTYGTSGSGFTSREGNSSSYNLERNLFYTPNAGYYIATEFSSGIPYISIFHNIYDDKCSYLDGLGNADSIYDNLPFSLTVTEVSQIMPGYTAYDYRYALDYSYPTAAQSNGITALEGGLSLVNPVGAYGNGGTPPLP